MNYKLNYLKDEMLVLIIYKKIDFAYDKISQLEIFTIIAATNYKLLSN